MITVEKTQLDGVLMIIPDCFEDHRGYYLETYNEKLYHEHGMTMHFVQDDASIATRHVLKGVHGDSETWKLISCLHGKFYFVVVNNDPESGQYKKWQGFTLSETNRRQILVPPKFGNGMGRWRGYQGLHLCGRSCGGPAAGHGPNQRL